MNQSVMKVAMGAVAALMISGAAQATEVNISIRTNSDSHRQVRHYDGNDYAERRYVHDRSDYGYRDPDRYYGRPVYERHRPVYGHSHWRHDDCRLIIKKRVDHWGDVVVKRVKVCD